ncbi:amidohydrolase [Ammoniphilus sp. 3BR4]|uniref:amidohydrolase n=1 Tax=Ammoniphilus sp. 3BR4 TaxID=3158265 RepID=UPI003466D045
MDVISLRRDFHQYPEVGFTEFRTASRVVEILRSLGFDVIYGKCAMDGDSRRGVPAEEELQEAYERALRDGANPGILEKMKGGYTAVIGVLKGKGNGPTVAYRFDMDALPVKESQDPDHFPQSVGFGSKYAGNMHACAHDAHTAIGLGLAHKLSDRNFYGTVKLIFQPAEEGVRGAYAIVQKGILDDVDFIFCHHLGTNVATGEMYGGSSGFLASTKMAAHFYGVPSHAGASPEKGKNALMGAATALLNIHAIPRFSTGATRVNVGVLEGGTAANIIPEYAKMILETRSVSEEANHELERRVKNIIAQSAAMHELRYEIDIIGAAIPIHCDPELVAIAIEEAEHIEGFSSVNGLQESGALGSEDASFMIRRVQERGGKGTYMIIGTDLPAPHHHPKFDIQEEVLPLAVDLLYQIAVRMLSE